MNFELPGINILKTRSRSLLLRQAHLFTRWSAKYALDFRSLRRLAWMFVWVGLLAGPAFATVFEIDSEGNVIKIEGAQRRPYPTLATKHDRLEPQYQASGSRQRLHPDLEVSLAINSAAQSQQLDTSLIEAIGWQESRLNPQAISPKGAVGIMQLMPSTARALGVRSDIIHDNVRGGATYLRQMLRRYDGDLVLALAAYNAGPGAVDRYGGAPPYLETQAYIAAILERLAQQVVPVQSPSLPRQHP